MFDDNEIRFVTDENNVGLHILVGAEDEHMGIALCGNSRLFVDDTYDKDTWKTVRDFSALMLSDLCVDCFATVGRFRSH